MTNVTALYHAPDTPSTLTRPLFLTWVAAGFPSPADDHLDRDLDLHELLIQHPAATYYVRLAGDSMQGAGLYDGDILIMDHSLEPKHTDIVIAVAQRRVDRQAPVPARGLGPAASRQASLPPHHRHARPGAADQGRGDRQHPPVPPLSHGLPHIRSDRP